MRVSSPNDISDALSAGMESGGLLLEEADLSAAFYDLRSGVAGELFQKFVNYRLPLALIVSNPAEHGERFVELAREHQTHPLVRIFADRNRAEQWLARMQHPS